MDVHVERVAASREHRIRGTPGLAEIGVEDGFAVSLEPVSDFGEDLDGPLGECAVGFGADVDEEVALIAGAGDEVAQVGAR